MFNRKLYMVTYNKDYVNKMKANGKCTHHPDREVVPGHTVCQECIDNHKNCNKKYRDEWNNILRQRGQDKCIKCGYNKCISAIDLHHRDLNEKEFKISDLKRRKFKLEYLVELDKCDALCKNCHRELHSSINKDAYKRKCRIGWNIILKERKQDRCSRCGYNKSIYAINFHHVNPDEKEICIADLRVKKFKLEYLEELNKCIALCANCHAEIENGGS